MLFNHDQRVRDFLGLFWFFFFILDKSFLYFEGIFNKTIIPPALVGYTAISKKVAPVIRDA